MNPILVALDFDDLDVARKVAGAVLSHVGGFKVGLELLMGVGPRAVSEIADLGLPVFADAKLHDIPNTVERAAHRLALHGARWVTAHGAGGEAMLRAAATGLTSGTSVGAGVLAVTVLTSLSPDDLVATGVTREVVDQAVAVAAMARGSGCEGVVCSPREASNIKSLFPGLLVVTPGIRPADIAANDQKRTATPQEALSSGADMLVIGRPITDAADPGLAAAAIAESIGIEGPG